MTKHERLKANIENLDTDEIVSLWNYYCAKYGDSDQKIYDDQEYFWDNIAGESTYELMKIAASGDVDLVEDYVMLTNDCYQTFNGGDILDYVSVVDIVDWLLEYNKTDIMEEYDILPKITKEDICNVLCTCISGLTHAIEDANRNQISSVKGNVNQQIERLTQLKKDIQEMFETDED